MLSEYYVVIFFIYILISTDLFKFLHFSGVFIASTDLPEMYFFSQSDCD